MKLDNVLLSGITVACVLSYFNQVYAADTLQEAINDSSITSYTLTGDESYTGSIGTPDRSFTIDGGGYTLTGAGTGVSTNAYGIKTSGGNFNC